MLGSAGARLVSLGQLKLAPLAPFPACSGLGSFAYSVGSLCENNFNPFAYGVDEENSCSLVKILDR